MKKKEAALTESDIESVIHSRIERINGALEEYEKIRKFAVMGSDFPTDLRSVTVFQKVKIDRKAVEERYPTEIREIYLGVSERGTA